MESQVEISRMIFSKDAEERKKAAEQFEVRFAYLPDKNLAWTDLHRLISDNDINVRWKAAYTYFRKEMEGGKLW